MTATLNPLAADPPVRMVDRVVTIGGKRLRYSISDNVDAPWWAVNVHGFFAGGGVYWRESTRLAAKLGVRVVNPNMPGFAGSTAFAWDDLQMSSFADTLALLMDHLGIERALILGHSMGGAICTQFAHDYPERTLGLIYRDGVATSSWKERHGILKAVLAPVSPDLGDAADIAGVPARCARHDGGARVRLGLHREPRHPPERPQPARHCPGRGDAARHRPHASGRGSAPYDRGADPPDVGAFGPPRATTHR